MDKPLYHVYHLTLASYINFPIQLYSTGRRTAQIDTNGGTIGKYAWSYVRSLFLVDLPRRFSYDDKIDPVSIDNLEVWSLSYSSKIPAASSHMGQHVD